MNAPRLADLERFHALISEQLGLRCEEWRADALAEIFAHRLAATGCSEFDSYRARLFSTAHREGEIAALAEQLTIGETFFFRNADQFRALAEFVLPARIEARGNERRLRILSVGCSSGEEAYTLAMLVREAMPALSGWDIQIRGFDINRPSIEKAERAHYASWSLRATPEEMKRRWFREEGNRFVLDPTVRAMVQFELKNLVEADARFWTGRDCDVVFCRNMLMYFTPEVAQRVVRGITQALVPGGYLFLGHAETLRGISSGYHLCHTHDTFYYQRREGSSRDLEGALRTAWPQETVPAALPELVESSTSWLEAIGRASARIATLHADRANTRDSSSDSSSDRPSVDPSHAIPDSSSIGPDSSSIAPEKPDGRLDLVLESMRQERFSEAAQALAALPDESQEHADALLLRAVLLTNNGKLAESEEVCKKLLALDDLHAGAHYLFALCREHEGDLAGAAEHDRISAYLDAGFAMPHLHLGLLARRAGDGIAAQRELSQARSLLSTDDAARVLLFGGGFSRETLIQLCSAELLRAGVTR